MADKTYKADIGMDEVNDDLFTCIVYCVETGEHLCLAYGKTPEECELNAKRIAWAMTNLEDVMLILNEIHDQDNATMSRQKLSGFAGELVFSAIVSRINE